MAGKREIWIDHLREEEGSDERKGREEEENRVGKRGEKRQSGRGRGRERKEETGYRETADEVKAKKVSYCRFFVGLRDRQRRLESDKDKDKEVEEEAETDAGTPLLKQISR